MFTFIFYFRGGTYVTQVKAATVIESMEVWAKGININDIQYFGKVAKVQLVNQVMQKEPTLLSGLTNIWYVDFRISGVYAHAHIVKTESAIM